MGTGQLSRTVFLSIGGVALISALVSGCSINSIASTITGITPTPVTPSPTPRVCPDISLAPQGGQEPVRTFLVILFDEKTTQGQAVLEYQDSTRTSNVVGFIERALPRMLGPGDQYSAFQLGYRTYEGARYERYSSGIASAPEPFPTPASHETLTPIATPAVLAGTPGLVILQHKANFGTAVAQQRATSTQLAFEDLCQISAYATAYQSTSIASTATNQTISTQIATNIAGDHPTPPAVIETPFAANVVYEGLGHASIDFEAQCPEYDRCVLLVFDDLIDWRNAGPNNKIPNIHFYLEGVKVVVVMPNCRDIDQPSCTRVQDLWTDEFLQFGAQEPVVYLNGDRLEANLLAQIGDE